MPPWAPKKPRHNKFTETETSKQKKWLGEGKSKKNNLGPLAPEIEAYIAEHDSPKHSHVNHPISSQAACFQFFAPLLTRQPGADQGWLELLSPHLAALSVKPTDIEECHFEYPHQARCKTDSKPCNHDMALLVGEKGSKTTRLDAFLKVKGTKNGTEIRVAVGVEFKYTESEFSRCGGFSSRNNKDGHVCLGRKAGDRRTTCYLRKREARKYLTDESLAAFFKPESNPLTAPGPCLLLGPANQIYRSQYTTWALAEAMGCQEWLFAVLAHDGNEELFRPERDIPGHPAFERSGWERYADSLTEHFRERLAGAVRDESGNRLLSKPLQCAGMVRCAVGEVLVQRREELALTIRRSLSTILEHSTNAFNEAPRWSLNHRLALICASHQHPAFYSAINKRLQPLMREFDVMLQQHSVFKKVLGWV